MAPDPLIGAVLDGRYQVVERIAEGAMGVVYRGERTKLHRAVAVKFLHGELADEPARRQRFEIEARAMARLDHPHCAAVIDVGLHEGMPYVVMDYVRGLNLRDVLDDGPIDPPRAVAIMRQILSGLAHAHELGIFHRDIKPANLIVTERTGVSRSASSTSAWPGCAIRRARSPPASSSARPRTWRRSSAPAASSTRAPICMVSRFSRPSGGRPIFTLPEMMMYRHSPGSPSAKTVCPRGKSTGCNCFVSAETAVGSTPWKIPALARISSTLPLKLLGVLSSY